MPQTNKPPAKTLKKKIFDKGVKEITIILDSDAVNDSVKHSEYFIKNGISVKNIIPIGKDAGDMGFDEVNDLVKTANVTAWDSLILSKLNNL